MRQLIAVMTISLYLLLDVGKPRAWFIHLPPVRYRHDAAELWDTVGSSISRYLGGEVTVDASKSSQFISGLLLSAARFNTGITVHHVGDPIPSMPHIDMTVAMLAEHGVPVRRAGETVWLSLIHI